jgi:hypothetical protein
MQTQTRPQAAPQAATSDQDGSATKRNGQHMQHTERENSQGRAAPDDQGRTPAAAIGAVCVPPARLGEAVLDPDTRDYYCRAIETLRQSRVPFLVGGAYAFERYTGIARHTKDFDIFVRPADLDRTLEVFKDAGYHTELAFPHWLGKAFCSGDFIDVIFGSGNGVAVVDDEWFEHAVEASVLGIPLQLCPAEEMIWSKAFIQERERFDGADVAHVLRAQAEHLDWERLLRRFGARWRVLLSHLTLFGFIYPAERDKIPAAVMEALLERMQKEVRTPAPTERVCQGTILSREQYLVDVERWGYADARLAPRGAMSQQDVDHWTAAIDSKD